MANEKHLPKKVLKITDLTFILPDNFEGDFEDAVLEFLVYRNNHLKARIPDNIEKYSSTEILLANGDAYLACGAYALLKLDDNGKYIPMQDI